MKIKALSVLVILVISGCAVQFGYVKPEPYAEPPSDKIDKKLFVFIDNVRDTVIMSEPGEMRGTTLTALRTSFADGMKKVLLTRFSHVEVTRKKPESGLVLHINLLEPFWKTSDPVTTFHILSGTTSTAYYTKAEFKFKASLYSDGRKIAQAEENASGTIMKNPFRKVVLKNMYISGLRATIEKINMLIMSPESIEKIQRR